MECPRIYFSPVTASTPPPLAPQVKAMYQRHCGGAAAGKGRAGLMSPSSTAPGGAAATVAGNDDVTSGDVGAEAARQREHLVRS